MRIISKLFIWIASLILIFILANLSIWAYKIGSLTNYVIELNQKSRSESIHNISLVDPVSIFSIFAVDYDNKLEENSKKIIQQDTKKQDELKSDQNIITGDQNLEINTGKDGEKIDPYDPEFEDEFNSFFGDDDSINSQDSDINTGTKNNQSDIENTVSGKEDHEVVEALIERFNEE